MNLALDHDIEEILMKSKRSLEKIQTSLQNTKFYVPFSIEFVRRISSDDPILLVPPIWDDDLMKLYTKNIVNSIISRPFCSEIVQSEEKIINTNVETNVTESDLNLRKSEEHCCQIETHSSPELKTEWQPIKKSVSEINLKKKFITPRSTRTATLRANLSHQNLKKDLNLKKYTSAKKLPPRRENLKASQFYRFIGDNQIIDQFFSKEHPDISIASDQSDSLFPKRVFKNNNESKIKKEKENLSILSKITPKSRTVPITSDQSEESIFNSIDSKTTSTWHDILLQRELKEDLCEKKFAEKEFKILKFNEKKLLSNENYKKSTSSDEKLKYISKCIDRPKLIDLGKNSLKVEEQCNKENKLCAKNLPVLYIKGEYQIQKTVSVDIEPQSRKDIEDQKNQLKNNIKFESFIHGYDEAEKDNNDKILNTKNTTSQTDYFIFEDTNKRRNKYLYPFVPIFEEKSDSAKFTSESYESMPSTYYNRNLKSSSSINSEEESDRENIQNLSNSIDSSSNRSCNKIEDTSTELMNLLEETIEKAAKNIEELPEWVFPDSELDLSYIDRDTNQLEQTQKQFSSVPGTAILKKKNDVTKVDISASNKIFEVEYDGNISPLNLLKIKETDSFIKGKQEFKNSKNMNEAYITNIGDPNQPCLQESKSEHNFFTSQRLEENLEEKSNVPNSEYINDQLCISKNKSKNEILYEIFEKVILDEPEGLKNFKKSLLSESIYNKSKENFNRTQHCLEELTNSDNSRNTCEEKEKRNVGEKRSVFNLENVQSNINKNKINELSTNHKLKLKAADPEVHKLLNDNDKKFEGLNLERENSFSFSCIKNKTGQIQYEIPKLNFSSLTSSKSSDKSSDSVFCLTKYEQEYNLQREKEFFDKCLPNEFYNIKKSYKSEAFKNAIEPKGPTYSWKDLRTSSSYTNSTDEFFFFEKSKRYNNQKQFNYFNSEINKSKRYDSEVKKAVQNLLLSLDTNFDHVEHKLNENKCKSIEASLNDILFTPSSCSDESLSKSCKFLDTNDISESKNIPSVPPLCRNNTFIIEKDIKESDIVQQIEIDVKNLKKQNERIMNLPKTKLCDKSVNINYNLITDKRVESKPVLTNQSLQKCSSSSDSSLTISYNKMKNKFKLNNKNLVQSEFEIKDDLSIGEIPSLGEI